MKSTYLRIYLSSSADVNGLPTRVSGLQSKIQTLSDGEYAVAKGDVDRLRQELGQPPLPSLQMTLEEKSAQ